MEVPFETEYNRQDFLYQEISYMQGIYMEFHKDEGRNPRNSWILEHSELQGIMRVGIMPTWAL